MGVLRIFNVTSGVFEDIEPTDSPAFLALSGGTLTGVLTLANDVAPINFLFAGDVTVGAFIKLLASGTWQFRHDSGNGLVDRLHISSGGNLTLRDSTGAVQLTVSDTGVTLANGGLIASVSSTSNWTLPGALLDPIVQTVMDVDVVAGRAYQVGFNVQAEWALAGNRFEIGAYADGVRISRVALESSDDAYATVAHLVLWFPSVTETVELDLRVVSSLTSISALVGAGTVPAQFWVKDIGVA